MAVRKDINALMLGINARGELEPKRLSDGGVEAVRLIDENGIAYGLKQIGGKARVTSTPYLYDIAKGNIANHVSWSKIAFTPALTTTESDIWSAGGAINFPIIATPTNEPCDRFHRRIFGCAPRISNCAAHSIGAHRITQPAFPTFRFTARNI